jgi:hypothetical protein
MEKKISITEMDVLHFKNVVRRTCKHTLITMGEYIKLFFEIGCTAIELIYKGDKPALAWILTNKKCGYWAWFMVEYIRHDEKLHNSKIPYRDYEKTKLIWIDTFCFHEALDNFFKHKQA